MLCSGFLSPAGPELGCFEDGRRPLIPEVYPQSWLSIVTVLEMNYMTKIVNRTFVLNPLAAALAAVLVAPAALAAPFIPTTPGTNQLPGEGKVVVGGATGLVFTPPRLTRQLQGQGPQLRLDSRLTASTWLTRSQSSRGVAPVRISIVKTGQWLVVRPSQVVSTSVALHSFTWSILKLRKRRC